MLLSLALGIGIVNAQADTPMEAPATLNAVDFNFVGPGVLRSVPVDFQTFSCAYR
jgi:hypothetical protein